MSLTADITTPPVIVTQLPEEHKPIKVRKKRAPKHDFKDGLGRVFAHRHDNGRGWVADTAHVADTVYVGARSEVFGMARVTGTAKLKGRARVHGNAIVDGRPLIEQNAEIYGRAQIRDETQIHDNVHVSGNACVCGRSNIFGSYRIAEHAHILASCLHGGGLISGEAAIMRSSFSGHIDVRQNATVVNATVSGRVSLRDFCQLLNSTINFSSTADANYTLIIKDFAVVADNSQINMPITIGEHAVIVRSVLAGYDWHGNALLVASSNIILSNRRLHNYAAVAEIIGQYATAGNAMYNPPRSNSTLVRGPVQVQPTQRRVMRLQEVAT